MEEIRLTAELKKNCETNREKLSELMKVYDLAALGYDMQEQRCKDIYNKVLSENEFYAERDCGRCEIKVGERITDEKFDFLLSDEDFERLETLAHPIFVAEGITDEKGYFIENWVTIKISARKDLVEFIIQNIVPFEMRETFWEARQSIVQTDKLISIMRSVA
jgi:hypothetical protein